METSRNRGKICKPVFVPAILAMNNAEKGILEPLGNRTRLAVANNSIVNLPQRSEFSSSTGQEGLISYVEVIPGKSLLYNCETHISCNLNNRLSCYTCQYGCKRGSFYNTFTCYKYILPAPFRNITIRVQEYSLIITGGLDLFFGKYGIYIITWNLSPCHRNVHMMSCKLGYLRPDPFLKSFIA